MTDAERWGEHKTWKDISFVKRLRRMRSKMTRESFVGDQQDGLKVTLKVDRSTISLADSKVLTFLLDASNLRDSAGISKHVYKVEIKLPVGKGVFWVNIMQNGSSREPFRVTQMDDGPFVLGSSESYTHIEYEVNESLLTLRAKNSTDPDDSLVINLDAFTLGLHDSPLLLNTHNLFRIDSEHSIKLSEFQKYDKEDSPFKDGNKNYDEDTFEALSMGVSFN
jgi:hypothetical protein